MLLLTAGSVPKLTTFVAADGDTNLTIELRRSSKPFNYTPDVMLEMREISLRKDKQKVDLAFEGDLEEPQYVFVTFLKNEHVQLQYSPYA